jgi:ribosomal-protein-alanine N-acetyltransferase
MAASPAPQFFHARRGGADDLDDVMRIMGGAFRPCFGEGWSRSQCAGIMPMAGVTLTIVEADGGDSVGFALARSILDEAELLLLAVDPAWQGQGVGQILLDDFIDNGRRSDLRFLHLEVREANPAVRMYHRAGFEMIGRRANYYRSNDGSRHDAVTMAINLR